MASDELQCPDIATLLLPSVTKALHDPHFALFVKPVAECKELGVEVLAEYKEKIQTPMDLRTLSEGLRDGSYTGGRKWNFFFNDAALISSNCKKFNSSNRVVWREVFAPIVKAWDMEVAGMRNMWTAAGEIFKLQPSMFRAPVSTPASSSSSAPVAAAPSSSTPAAPRAPVPAAASAASAASIAPQEKHRFFSLTAWLSRPEEYAFADVPRKGQTAPPGWVTDRSYLESSRGEGVGEKCGRFQSPQTSFKLLVDKVVAREIYRSDKHVYFSVDIDALRSASSASRPQPGTDFVQPYFRARLADGKICCVQSGLGHDIKMREGAPTMCAVEIGEIFLDEAHRTFNICASPTAASIAEVGEWLEVNKSTTITLPGQIATVADSNDTIRIASAVSSSGLGSQKKHHADGLAVSHMTPQMLPTFFAAVRGNATDLCSLLSANFHIRKHIAKDLMLAKREFRILCNCKRGDAPLGDWAWNPEDLTELNPFPAFLRPYSEVLAVILTFFNGQLPGCDLTADTPVAALAKRMFVSRLKSQRPALGRLFAFKNGAELTAGLAKKVADSHASAVASGPEGMAQPLLLSFRAVVQADAKERIAAASSSAASSSAAAASSSSKHSVTALVRLVARTTSPLASSTFVADLDTAKEECMAKCVNAALEPHDSLSWRLPAEGMSEYAYRQAMTHGAKFVHDHICSLCFGDDWIEQRNALLAFPTISFNAVRAACYARFQKKKSPQTTAKLACIFWLFSWEQLRRAVPECGEIPRPDNTNEKVSAWMMKNSQLDLAMTLELMAEHLAGDWFMGDEPPASGAGSKRPRESVEDDDEVEFVRETTRKQKDATLRTTTMDLCGDGAQ